MSFSPTFSKIIPLSIIVFSLVTYNFMNAAWTNPIPTAPNNNTEAPVSVSALPQVKLGGLGTGPLSITGDAQLTDTDPTIRFEDTDGSRYWVHNNSGMFYVLADRDDSGVWETPNPLVISASTTGDYATFADQVRAREYCDRNGGNCFTPSQVGLGGLSTYSHKNNPRSISRPGNGVCSCRAGDWLTGCSGPQSGDYDTSAIVGSQACYGEADVPVCTCLTTN